MDFVNFETNNFSERNKFNSELSSLNEQKESQVKLLTLFIDGNKDVFGRGNTIDFNSFDNINQLREAFIYLNYSIRYSGIDADRASRLSGVLDDFYVKLADYYDKRSELNEKIEKYDNEHKNDLNDEDLKPSVEYINSINEISDRIGEKRNKIAVITNYIRNIDTEEFMKNNHREMAKTLEDEINLDMAEICKLLASKGLSVDNYRDYRSNVRYNLNNMNSSNLSLSNTSYDVIYYEYDKLVDMLKDTKVANVEEHETLNHDIEHDEPTPSAEEIPEEDASLGNTPEENIDEEFNVDVEPSVSDNSDTEDEEVEREPESVDNSPLTQFKDKYKHPVKGISTASNKLKANINSKVLQKSALRWVGVVGVLAVAAVINPALLFGGAAIGAGVYEYNIAKKMK